MGDKRALLDPGDRLTHVIIDVCERLQGERWPNTGLRVNLCLDGIVGKGQHSAVRVVDQDDFGRAQHPLGDG
jgi:hypothetical protein